jgi:hypothetical protein
LLVSLAHAKFIPAALNIIPKNFKHVHYVIVKVIGRGIMRKWMAEDFDVDNNASANLD